MDELIKLQQGMSKKLDMLLQGQSYILEQIEKNRLCILERIESSEIYEKARKWECLENLIGSDDGVYDPGDLSPELIAKALRRNE